MPEGPEIRVLSDSINSVFQNKYLISIWFDPNFNHFKNLSLVDLPQRLIRCYSIGKKIIFQFENGFLISSLGMVGSWSLESSIKLKPSTLFRGVWGDKIENPSNNFFQLERILSYADQRHFGHLEYFATEEELNTRLDLGLDLLQKSIENINFYEEWKKALLRGKKSQICEVLMEQKYISGIGNHLRANIMYHAKINPKKIVGTLTSEELKRLYDSSRYIIVKCYEEGGAEGDYTDLNGNYGKYEHICYGKKRDSSENIIESFVDKGKRTVWFCPEIQKFS